MQKTLRNYQAEVLSKLRQRLKQTTNPLLVNASVGSGKSIVIAELLLIIERAGWRALCLTMNSTLIQQNAETYNLQGGQAGIYCAGLGAKDTNHAVIFGSPHSVSQGIRNKTEISKQPFRLIVVDEAHNIDPNDNNTMYMRILNHYGLQAQTEGYSYRVVGLTGTPYRGKGISIVGHDQYFNEEVCNISTSWLIEQGFLTPPRFGLTHVDGIDFSHLRVDSMGKFKHKELEAVLENNERLTGEIMRELVSVIESGRQGAFVFASTRKHCLECAKSLPDGQWAIVTGETPHEERKKILLDAKNGHIKYLISVGCLNVGVDVPNYDVCCWVRPTESLVLYTQGIGRVLRLHPEKTEALILDYAGNLERHGDIDDPIINAALAQQEGQEEDFCIPCYDCNTLNKVTTRRCIGVIDKKRCDHYFEFKECPSCQTQNDIVSRECRSCEAELIDPNAKLKPIAQTYTLDVSHSEFWIMKHTKTQTPIINCRYITNDADVFECYFTNTEKAKNVFYAKFVRPQIENASDYYLGLANIERMNTMLAKGVKSPSQLVCNKDDYGKYHVIKKVFDKTV